MTDAPFLAIEVASGVATVRIDKPAKRNTFTADDHRELADLYRRLQQDDDVRAVIVTGEGSAFCGGPDRGFQGELMAPEGHELRSRIMEETHRFVHDAIGFDRPVITAVNGPAVGMGLAVALLADIVLVEEHVTLRDGHILGGLTAGDGGTLLWPAAMGLLKAKRYLLTSDPLSAAEAERLGLVSEVVPSGTSVARARQFAQRFATGPQFAIRSTKRALNLWLRDAASSVFDVAWALEEISMANPDAAEAARTLREAGVGAIRPDPGPA